MDIFYLYIDKFDFSAGKKYTKHHRAGRYILDYAAEKFFDIKNPEIEITDNKPRFMHSDINFSISHSGNIAAVCFDKNPAGFDIEIMKPRDFMPLADRMNFQLKENTLEEFYRCWTKYEAEYKLQTEAKTSVSMIFQEKYMLSTASGSENKIELNFYEIKE